MRALLFFFFVSGFPALIYQIIWQRALFGIFGSNIEAVTLVVSSFMLGLGLGSLVGGKLSSYSRIRPLLAFGIFELAVGIFGIGSLSIIDLVGSATVGVGTIGTFFVSFLTVLVPTVLMGAALPLLLVHLVRKNGEVGKSVSLLYSVNTWGAAVACFVGAALVFGSLGMQGSVYLAAAMNVFVGVMAVYFSVRSSAPKRCSGTADSIEDAPVPQSAPCSSIHIGLPAAILLAGFSGFIALSYEILWTRVFFLQMHGRAFAFPIVLGLFLAGIAVGASEARRRLDSFRAIVAKWHLLPFAALFFFANAAGFFVIPALIGFAPLTHGIAALLLVISAAAFGATLPLLSDIAIAASRVSGQRVSYLYVANIVGSTVGTIVTGLVLLDLLPLRSVASALFLTGLTVSCILLFFQPVRIARFTGCGLAFSGVLPALLLLGPPLHTDLYETLQFGSGQQENYSFKHVAETKSGVVAITEDDVVFGSGVYDGMAQIDLLDDRNSLFRATAVAAVHPAPKEVLVIGLSAGAWTQVLANLNGVERVTVIEINRGYLELIREYPDIRSVLENPKVDIVVDDGRRWLQRNPDKKFDLIVANTTFYWRAGATNLLSVEFLELVRSHLKQNGVYYYNTTKSASVQKTGASVFTYAARFEHMLFVSDSPILFDQGRWLRALEDLTVDGSLLLDLSRPEDRKRATEIVSYAQRVGPLNEEDEMEFAVEFRTSILDRTADHPVITDDNMGAEWRVPFFH